MYPRDTGSKLPLAEPASDSKEDFVQFIARYIDKDPQLMITPTQRQRDTWRINFNGKQIPIGATGVWHPFTTERETFMLQGFKGCTAIIIVVKDVIRGDRYRN